METGTGEGVMQPQATEPLGPPESGRGRKDSPEESGRKDDPADTSIGFLTPRTVREYIPEVPVTKLRVIC